MFLITKVQTDPKRYEFICWGIERRRRKSIKNIKYYLLHSNLNVLFYRVDNGLLVAGFGAVNTLLRAAI
jgi:hypothetical protein